MRQKKDQNGSAKMRQTENQNGGAYRLENRRGICTNAHLSRRVQNRPWNVKYWKNMEKSKIFFLIYTNLIASKIWLS